MTTRIISASWIYAGCFLVCFIAWMIFDCYSESATWSVIRWCFNSGLAKPSLTMRECIAFALATINALCFPIMLIGMGFGNQRQRSVRSIMALTAIFAAWFLVIQNSTAIFDFGRTFRIARQIGPLNDFASRLESEARDASKKNDGSKPPWSCITIPHQIYQHYQTQIFMFPGTYSIPNTSLSIIAVECTPGQAVRLELAGGEYGCWAEFRKDGSDPQPFVGGLGEAYVPNRVRTIAQHWRLVVYRRVYKAHS